MLTQLLTLATVPFLSLGGAGEAKPSEPLSRSFAALDASTQAAVRGFFLHGPGATPPGGTVDASTHPFRRHAVPGYPGLFHITIGNTGSGYLEKFLLQIPDGVPAQPAPLLVVFHKFGVSHADVLLHTSFVDEARARGWYLIAPLGAQQNNFGALAGQINVRAALDFTRNEVSIDDARIYGVGFSMGGGSCTSFAARHLDPAGAMFAAVVNHTGTVSLANVHANESPEIRAILEGWFGGSPAAQPFAYQRCSVVDIDSQSGLVGAGTDMARNLKHLAIRDWMASNDPQPYLPAQTQAFHGHVQGWNGANVLTVVNASVHDWSSLDETLVCNWLAGFTLQLPTSGTLLADENGTWMRFQVEQDSPGAFTPISWSAVASANKLELWGTANLKRLSVDVTQVGLAYAGSLYAYVTPSDGTGDQVLLLDVPYAPNAVYRNGVPTTATFDPLAHTLLVDETGGAGGLWVVVF